MIVLAENDGLLLITQGDHAHLAAELLSLCRFPELTAHPRRRQLLEATREHDNGWREPDAAPTLDSSSGLPFSYLTLPDEERRRLWTRACVRFRDSAPYVALLITQNALALHLKWADRAEWSDWLAEIETLRDELLEPTDCELETLDNDYSLLRFADLCALAVCGASPEAFEHHGVSGRSSAGTLYLDPLPLAGATSFRLACRHLPQQHYRTAAELGDVLLAARWEQRTVRVAADGD